MGTNNGKTTVHEQQSITVITEEVGGEDEDEGWRAPNPRRRISQQESLGGRHSNKECCNPPALPTTASNCWKQISAPHQIPLDPERPKSWHWQWNAGPSDALRS